MGVIAAGDSLSRAFGINLGGALMAVGPLREPFAIGGILYAASVVLFYIFFWRNGGAKPSSVKLEQMGS